MDYTKPSLARVDLMVEHCMCCTVVEDILTGCDGGSNPLLMPVQ